MAAVEALGLIPDPMRGSWNAMPLRDRRFLLHMAGLGSDSRQSTMTWDQLPAIHQAMIRNSLRRFLAWAVAAGVDSQAQAQASA